MDRYVCGDSNDRETSTPLESKLDNMRTLFSILDLKINCLF